MATRLFGQALLRAEALAGLDGASIARATTVLSATDLLTYARTWGVLVGCVGRRGTGGVGDRSAARMADG